jgi:uncharacterized membrane protein YgcG
MDWALHGDQVQIMTGSVAMVRLPNTFSSSSSFMASEPRSPTMSSNSHSASSNSTSSMAPPHAVPLNHMVHIKLTQENYLLWQTQMLPYLRSQSLLGYVDGSIPQPSQTIVLPANEETGESRRIAVNPAYTSWYFQDQLVLSTIVSSLSEEALGHLIGVTSAFTAWRTLERAFAATSRARIMQIRMQLSTTKKGDMSVTAYYRKMKSYGDTLAAVGKPLDNEELIAYILQGLGGEYESLITSITTQIDSYTLSDVFAHMLSAEMCVERNTSEGQISANSANRGGRGGGRNGRGRGRGGGRFPGRGGRQDRSNKNDGTPCQICGKTGHEAAWCWHRFDQNYQPEEMTKVAATAASGSYAVDPDWYVDTGATDHITHDLDRLTTKERYTGGDQVHVASGSGLSITHVGNSLVTGLDRPLYLKHILHVPQINKHLLSVRKLVLDNNAFVEFHPNCFFVKDRITKTILLRGGCKHGLYTLPSSSPSQALLSTKISQQRCINDLAIPQLRLFFAFLETINLL